MSQRKEQLDPRIIRTRQLLKNALVDLLKEMDLEKISVNRLAERATINRVTFYLHYKDIPDMLEKLADAMIEDISAVLAKANESSEKENDWIGMVAFLEHIEEHAEFYKTVLTSKRAPIFRDRLLIFLRDIIETKGSHYLPKGIQNDIFVWYDSSAVIGTIIAWLQNDMPYSPAFLVKQFSLLHHRVLNQDIKKVDATNPLARI